MSASAAVQTLFERHRRGQGDFARLLFGVIALQCWHDHFVKGSGLYEV
jgi:hypothetical protein